MEQLKVISFLILGIAALVFNLKDKSELKSVVLFLLTIASTFLIIENVEGNEQKDELSSMLLLYLSINFLFSRFNRVRVHKLNFLIPLFSSFLLLFIGRSTFGYNQYDFSFSHAPIVILVIFGSMIFAIARFKRYILSMILGEKVSKSIEQSFFLFLIGFSVFIGSFVASNFGVFLISMGLIAQSFFQTENKNNYGISILLISLTHYFAVAVQTDVVDLSLGKTVEGIFIGVFAVLFLNTISTIIKNRGILLIGATALVVSLIIGVLLLSTQKSDFGGMDAFICETIGIALALTFLPEFKYGEMLFSFVIAGGLFFGPLTINKEEIELTEIKLNNTTVNTTEKNKSLFEIPGIPLDSIIGNYSIDEKSVQLAFKLGPKGGVTKGSFRSFGGKINISSTIESSTFNIELPVQQLTTFNKLRDESIFEKDYLNLNSFPKILYSGSKLTKSNDQYLLDGNFKMLGISKPLQVELKYIGMYDLDGIRVPVIIGRSSIDRTQFGMKPDSKEGNIVDFEFKIHLLK